MEKAKKRHKIVLLRMVICAHILCLSQYVFAQQPVGSGKTSKHGRYCYCEKGKDTVLTIYRAVWLNTDTIPSVAIKADSVSYIINQIKRELGGEIVAFLKKNQLFLDDYFRLSRSTGKEELVHINMCEVLNSQYGYKKYNQYAKKLGRIVSRVNLILNDQTNAICELEISTAPKTVVLDDVILVQSSVCDLKKNCIFAHSGQLNNRFFLNSENMGYFQKEPMLNSVIGFFENNHIVVLSIPILEDDIYYADVTLTLYKK